MYKDRFILELIPNIYENKLIFNEMMVRFALYFCNDSSLKQQPAVRHVAPLGHIIMIPSQPVCALSH